MVRYFILAILVVVPVAFFWIDPGYAQRLTLNKSEFGPGEPIVVTFVSRPSLYKYAWIGLVPSHVPHGSASANNRLTLARRDLMNLPSGTMVFAAPGRPGRYDFRMHDMDMGGQEVASVSFTVAASSLYLDKVNFVPGEEINVYFKAPKSFAEDGWIGIVSSDFPHGDEMKEAKYGFNHQSLQGRTSGLMSFKAPSRPGSYDFRLYDTSVNGREFASVSFQVAASPLRLDKTYFEPGERISLRFTAPAAFAGDAWVGIIPSQTPHGSERVNDEHVLVRRNLNKRTSGFLNFTAPMPLGTYDFRLHDSDDNGREIAFVTFIVRVEPKEQDPVRIK